MNKYTNCKRNNANLEINVSKDELLVGGVDDGGTVRTHEHVRRRFSPEHQREVALLSQ